MAQAPKTPTPHDGDHANPDHASYIFTGPTPGSRRASDGRAGASIELVARTYRQLVRQRLAREPRGKTPRCLCLRRLALLAAALFEPLRHARKL
eukprot:3795050-Lingulodinium_polyedra.AAC.1